MKKLTLILTPFILLFSLHAEEFSSGSTFHQYSKPGASIDMEYNSTKVDVNETSDVNITLSTPLTRGDISVEITADESLQSISEFSKNLYYNVQPQEQEFIINLQFKAEKEGLYYVRLLTKVNNGYGPKLRSFAVPIYVGKESQFVTKSRSSQMKALSTGENISVSKAVETIKVLKEK